VAVAAADYRPPDWLMHRATPAAMLRAARRQGYRYLALGDGEAILIDDLLTGLEAFEPLFDLFPSNWLVVDQDDRSVTLLPSLGPNGFHCRPYRLSTDAEVSCMVTE